MVNSMVAIKKVRYHLLLTPSIMEIQVGVSGKPCLTNQLVQTTGPRQQPQTGSSALMKTCSAAIVLKFFLLIYV